MSTSFQSVPSLWPCQYYNTDLQIRVLTGKLFFLFLNQNICCRYSKHMFKLMGKQINAILGAQTILSWTYELYINVMNGSVHEILVLIASAGAAKVQTSLCMRTVSPEPVLLVYIRLKCQKTQTKHKTSSPNSLEAGVCVFTR